MTDEMYNHYITLINRRYKYDFNNEKRYGLVLKLMAWNYNNKDYHKQIGVI